MPTKVESNYNCIAQVYSNTNFVMLKAMKKIYRMIGVTGLILFFVACATERKGFTPTECNYDGGHDRGFAEGKSGRDPDTNYVNHCRDDLRDAVRKGYREGYDQGRKEYKERIAEWQAREDKRIAQTQGTYSAAPAPQPIFECSIQHQGRGFRAQDASMASAQSAVVAQCATVFPYKFCAPLSECHEVTHAVSDRAIYCKLEVFNQSYDAFAATLLEARIAVRKSCELKEGSSSIFCNEKNAKCQRSQ